MERFSVGDIVFVRFPFSDLSAYKLRPALVLARASKHDFVLSQITSRPYGDEYAVQLTQDNFIHGTLRTVSYVRPAKIFTAHVGLIEKRSAHLKSETRKTVVSVIVRLLHGEI